MKIGEERFGDSILCGNNNVFGNTLEPCVLCKQELFFWGSVFIHPFITYWSPVREGGQYNQKEQMYKRSGDNQREQVCVSS